MSLLSTFIPIPAEDAVGIFDEDGNQLFSSGRPLRMEVKRPSKTFTHPLEDNTNLTDFKIIEQIQIEISLLLQGDEGVNTYAQIEAAYLENTILEVRGKFKNYKNMIISDMPHDELPEGFDSIILPLGLTELQIEAAETIETSQDFNTQNRGKQEPEEATETETENASTLYKIFIGD